MGSSTNWLLRSRGLPLFAAAVAITFSLVLVARGTTDTGSTPFVELALLGVLAIAAVLALTILGSKLAGLDPDVGAIAQGFATSSAEQRLLSRWLQRSRWARNVGGIAGLTWWVLGTSLQGDPLLYGVGGIAIGSMAAELHHVRPPTGQRTASLTARTVTSYLPPRWQRHMIVVTVISLVMALLGAATADARPATWWGLAALTVLGAAHAVQRRVAARPRPALSVGLQRADDLARGLAIDRGLAQPATYCALALFAHGARHLESPLGGLATAMSIGAWLYALHAWWHNRRLGLDFMIEQHPIASSHA